MPARRPLPPQFSKERFGRVKAVACNPQFGGARFAMTQCKTVIALFLVLQLPVQMAARAEGGR